MALSANAQLKEVKPQTRNLPAQAAVRAYTGSACTIDPDGNVGPLASGERFVGHAFTECNNSSGAAAAKDVELMCGEGGVYFLEVTLTCTTENEGQNVYMTDDATYSLDPMGASTPNVLVGTVWRYVSSTKAVVRIDVSAVNVQALDTQTVGRFFEDFLGDALLMDGTHGWKTVDVAGATEAIVEDGHGGQFKLAIVAAAEAQDAVLYMGDNAQFDINSLLKMRFRAKITGCTAGITLVAGMADTHNLDKDTVNAQCWFRCQGSLAVVCESDDGGAVNNDDIAALTVTTDVWYDYEIDFSDVADVKFFINGAQVAGGTTFVMSVFTGTLQPYFSLDSADATADNGALTIDYVEILFRRE